MSSVDVEEDDPLLEYINEFVMRVHQGDRPSIDEYCQRCPEHAEELKELLEALE